MKYQTKRFTNSKLFSATTMNQNINERLQIVNCLKKK